LGRGDGTFRAPVPYDSGGINHASLAVTDLNGDSKLDVAIANATGLIRVLLGRGDGTFEVAENPSTVDGASSVAAGDLNRDGKMDLAVASSAGSVTVLIGKGDGSFQSNRTYFTAGGGATGIGIDDLNNDGVPDLLISVSADFFFDAKASVMFGNGNGTFRPSTSYSSGGVFATSVAFGDLNKDGRLDFLVANTCAGGTDCNNTADDGAVSVFVNKGQGTFKAARVYVNSDCEESAVANGDFNRDGNADLAVTESCIGVPSGQVTIWLGRTNGVFKPGLTFPLAGHYVSSIHVADFNGDGKLDLVAASNCTNTDTCGTGSAGLSVLLGNGDGTFQPAQRQSLGGFFAYSVAVGNFDGDDVPDLAVFQRTICGTTGGCLPSSVSILLGNGDGTFGVSHTYASGGGTGRFELGILPVNFLSVADFNGDAKDDLAIANPCLDIYGCSSGTLRVLLGQGDGTFKVSQYKLVLPPLAVGITFGDLNNDDKLDLAVVSLVKIPAEISAPGVVSVLIGNGKGSFQTGPTYESGGTRARSIAIGDFNGDGERDVLVANDGNTGLLIGNGDATLQPPQLYNAGGPGIAIGDFNRDGRPDVAFAGTVILLNIAPRTTR